MRPRSRSKGRFLFAVVGAGAAVLALAGCAGGSAQRGITGPGPGGSYLIGKPYQIKGKWYFPAENTSYDEVGLASWYGREFHGNSTANGERFDTRRMTAAHTTLPMPVLVRVTNLENGRSMLVRVNDRGPFVDGRVIDLSEAAAETLGFRGQGIARVRVQYIARADQTAARPGPAPPPSTPAYTLSAPPRGAPPPGTEKAGDLSTLAGVEDAIRNLPSGPSEPLTQ